jgi:hypothetical protein
MATGRLQGQIAVGDVIKIVGVVTAIAEGTQPTVTITTKYPNFAGAKTSITVDTFNG